MHLSSRFRIQRRSGSGLPPTALRDELDRNEHLDDESQDRDAADYAGVEATACPAVFLG
ncbi:hypothetical protein ACT8ZV_12735 [Nocardioides sp. MAHUQ-72]|uniref:hypothetical protein n=1 Tax=unclassified Nocardioides TaxID=2615069 RepID=UPI0036117E4E